MHLQTVSQSSPWRAGCNMWHGAGLAPCCNQLTCHCACTAGYLCPLSANTYGIEFLKFDIRDYDTGKTVYQVRSSSVAFNCVQGSVGVGARRQHGDDAGHATCI